MRVVVALPENRPKADFGRRNRIQRLGSQRRLEVPPDGSSQEAGSGVGLDLGGSGSGGRLRNLWMRIGIVVLVSAGILHLIFVISLEQIPFKLAHIQRH